MGWFGKIAANGWSLDMDEKTHIDTRTTCGDEQSLTEGSSPTCDSRNDVEEALRASEMRFRSIADSALDAIVSVSSEDKITFWNQGAQRIFGYSEEEVIGKSVTIIIPERYKQHHRDGMKRYLKTRRPALIGRTAELQARRKDGTEFPIELSLSTWTSMEGTFFTGIIRDISLRKETELALARSTSEAKQRTEELESLIQMVAHDLKSPVVTICGLVRILEKSLAGNKASDEKSALILHQLETSSQTMERFLKDLLDGLASQHSEQQQALVRLDECVNEVIAAHRQRAAERGISLRLVMHEAVSPVAGDRHRLSQVIDNLVGNAIKHMGDGQDPRVIVQLLEEENTVITKISDNGVGIALEHQSKIFDRFFRVPGKGEQSGTGLGLSIVKKIVESHGGEISLAPGELGGATFVIRLPKAITVE
jgi:PAS domain S-box-containing protein